MGAEVEFVDDDILESVTDFTYEFDIPRDLFLSWVEFVYEFVNGVVNEVLAGEV